MQYNDLMGYRTTFLTGVSWSGGLKILSKLLTTLKLIILARILSPNDFGLFSLTLVAISLFEVFTETGINTIMVQSKKDISHFIDTAWIVSIVRGLIIALVMFVIRTPMSQFYDEPMLLNLILLACVIPLIRGLINPANVTFHKNLEFRSDTLYRFSLVISDVLLSIFFALWLKNVYAFILPMIGTAIFEVVLSFVVFKIKPRWKFQRPIFNEIMSHTKWLNGMSIIDYLNRNLDDMIIGKVLGTAQLGIYRNGYAVSQSGTADLSASVLHASFPIFTKLQAEPERLKKALLDLLLTFTLLLSIPTAIFIFLPSLVVEIILGDGWTSVVSILPILAIAGFIQATVNICTNVFTAMKKYHAVTAIQTITFLTMIITIVPLSLSYGLIGASWSIVLSRIASIPVTYFYTRQVFTNSL